MNLNIESPAFVHEHRELLEAYVKVSSTVGARVDYVQGGGGNTSVKTVFTEMDGSQVDVLCVKGSGWDMGTIEPAGLPAVRLEPLKAMVKFGLSRLSQRGTWSIGGASSGLPAVSTTSMPTIAAAISAISSRRRRSAWT